MTGLAEQGAFAGTQENKEGLTLIEERAGDSSTGISLGHAESKLERQKPTQAGHCRKGQQKMFLQIA